ncbi:peptidase M23 [Croceibacterium mercuriale]|uniref:Peptidase M23 n=1 Tax=Croceibacterium mercuriale TaxID=1572751 RepID=A0A0B2BSA6_9SPHN|nr:conjugal transfer protein TraG N-terminal domain-containing protein [Croceibacterium mercuriale]KHL24269.1 peptidase M23 [Croceibacterium mercuriale]
MLEIFTIGGGEYIVNVLNAVSAWCGGGGFRSLLRVVMVIGLMYSLLVVAFSMNWRAWLNWFLGATLMYGALIVPTTSVKVTDRLNPALPAAVVDNVPVGLAVVASISSQMGDWMTRTAETVFTMPEALKLSTNGMIYGSRLFDRTREFRIRDPRAKANVEEYIRQCLFYDFMLGHKDIGAVANSANLLEAIGPGSPARGMRFVLDDGTSEIRTCNSGYATLANTTMTSETNVGLLYAARRLYPNLADAAARTKLDTDLPLIGNAFFGSSQTAAQLFQQRALVDAFLEARANLGGADGDTFSSMRADEQARNTYTSIADQAMTWVPLLNIVLTVVFYAMFPVIFPLFLLPQTGVPAVKGYFTGFFYLAAWGPLYAVLHMFIMDRSAKGMQAVTDGAVTMATLADIDAVNADTATIAGFMMMSIPFLAAGMARGAMAISSQATSMLAPAQSAAEAAAVERTTGNYSYGNLAYQNLTGNVRQSDQWNTAPSQMGGFGKTGFQQADGTSAFSTADGTSVFDTRGGQSSLAQTPSGSSGFSTDMKRALSDGYGRVQSTRQTATDRWSATATTASELMQAVEQRRGSSVETGSGLNNSISDLHDVSSNISSTLQSRFGLSANEADRIARTSTLTGDGSLSAGIPGLAGIGVRAAALATRETGRTVTAEEALSDMRDYVSRESNSSQARQAREDFTRETSSSSDSTVRSLSNRLGASIEQSRAASLEASQSEETYRRISEDVSQAEARGFRLDHNETQEFVTYAQNELAKDPILAASGWTPGVVVPKTAQQEQVRDYMLDGYMRQRVNEVREELGVAVPDLPSATMQGPSVATSDDVVAWGNARMAGVQSQGPDVDVRASSGDPDVARTVSDRLEASDDRIIQSGVGLGNELASGRQQARAVGAEVGERNHATLARTMPGLSNALEALDGGRSGTSAVVPLDRGQSPTFPVSGRLSSDMGRRVNPVTERMSNHNGQDIAAPAGTPIRPTASGTVAQVGYDESRGNYAVLDHADGSQSKYFHMQSASNYDVGHELRAGDAIGRVGSTGRSTGPHLHYELWKNGQPVDPRRYALRDTE